MLVIIEENYKISVWCREIVDGLRAEARKKRISLEMSTEISDVDREEGNTVIIIGAESQWLQNAAERAVASGKHPIILSNQSETNLKSGVSIVTEDIFGSMAEIISIFLGKGISQIALYAQNPDSASDSFKKEAFLALGRNAEDVFINEGSLEACFERFYEKHKEKRYGGIVCANDFAAISLIRHLKNAGEDIKDVNIISYSDTLISRCTSPAVSSVRANFKSFGRLAFIILDCISKSEQINGMHVSCKWEIIHRETSSQTEISARVDRTAPQEKTKSFYGDPALMEMMRIEDMLSQCDDIDLEIVSAVLSGKKTAEIADCCYLTESALKYRINKMKELCGTDSRAALRDFLHKYISLGVGNIKN